MRITIIAGLLLGVAAPTMAKADPVTDAMDLSKRLYQEANRATGPLNRPRTPLQDAHWSRLAAAMFEAANAADTRHESLLGLTASTTPASADAAVLAAAHGVLVHAFPNRKSELGDMLAFHLSQLQEGAARARGVQIGQEAAKLANVRVVFAEGAGPWLDQPSSGPGAFVGSNEPLMGSWRWGYQPWLLKDLKAIKPGTFPALNSDTYTRSFEETRRLGARDSKERTPLQTMAARFWADAVDFVPTVRNVALTRRLPTVEVARLNALLALARMDTIYAIDLNKIGEARWRPTTAIRLADRDDNPATSPDRAWEPYLRVPGSSEFPCGHCTDGAALGALFEAELGPYTAEAEFRSDDVPGMAIRGMRWSELGQHTSNSRIWGGVHFRYSADLGETWGRELAKAARANFPKPLTTRKR